MQLFRLFQLQPDQNWIFVANTDISVGESKISDNNIVVVSYIVNTENQLTIFFLYRSSKFLFLKIVNKICTEREIFTVEK